MAQISDDEKNENKRFEFTLFNKTWFTLVNKNTIRRTNENSVWRPCFGNTIIDITSDEKDDDIKIKKVVWEVKINTTTSKNIMIGVCKDNWITENNGCYTTANGYMKNCNGPYLYQSSSNRNYGKVINGSGSIVITELNVKEKTISFIIDGEKYGPAWSNIPAGKYRLALDLYNINDEVTILSEKIEYDHHLLFALDALNHWKNDIEFSLTAINQQQQNISNITLDNLLKDTQYISQVRNQINIIEQNVQDYKEKLNEYEKVVIKNLKPQHQDYHGWKAADLIKWIITLDGGIYNVYADKLYKAFKDNEISGDDIQQIGKNDLFLFGVTVFKHRVQLINHFASLGNNDAMDKGDDQEQDQDEGENVTIS